MVALSGDVPPSSGFAKVQEVVPRCTTTYAQPGCTPVRYEVSTPEINGELLCETRSHSVFTTRSGNVGWVRPKLHAHLYRTTMSRFVRIMHQSTTVPYIDRKGGPPDEEPEGDLLTHRSSPKSLIAGVNFVM